MHGFEDGVHEAEGLGELAGFGGGEVGYRGEEGGVADLSTRIANVSMREGRTVDIWKRSACGGGRSRVNAGFKERVSSTRRIDTKMNVG